ncbi:TPA: acyltransferase [Vibrio cholerae]|nr:acyltransferase [Vibrio cholerae]
MRRVESLDILRAFAALSVFFYHIDVVGNNPFSGFLNFGGIGVDLFFVLSGFFIGLSVIRQKEWCLRNFCRRRFLRIAPAYYVSILLMIAFVTPPYLNSAVGFFDIFSHVTFLHSLNYSTHGSLNGSYWSLGIEVYFYIIMALSAPLIRNKAWIVKVLFVWIALAWLWRYCVSTLSIEPIYKFIWSSQLPGMLDQFAFGIIIAWILNNNKLKQAIEKKITFFLAGPLCFFCLVIYLPMQGDSMYWSDWKILVFGKAMLGFSFAVLIIAFISFSHMDKLNRIAYYTGVPFIGKVSYSLYLYHLPIIVSMKNVGILNVGDIFSGVICLFVCLLVSSVSYYLIEKRFYNHC